MSEIIVLVTGGFDPIHSGHIAYLKDAKKLGDKLIVGVNSDQWLMQKKGSPFLPIEERIEIVSNLSVVDKAIEFNDDELNSASDAIQKVIDQYPDNKIIFTSPKNPKDLDPMCIGDNPREYGLSSQGYLMPC